MSQSTYRVAVFRGDGIGPDVTDATIAVLEAAQKCVGGFCLNFSSYHAGATYFRESGRDIEQGSEQAAEQADAILLGAIGLPEVRYLDGTEIAPHLRLREQLQLYAGVRPVRAYPNTPLPLADPRASDIDLVIVRESTEGLFYSAAVHGRTQVADEKEVRDTLRITRNTTEKLHDFAFQLARQRKNRGRPGRVTCVDKANVFRSMAFFRKIFDERAQQFPDISADHNYIDAQALDLIRKPWSFDVMVMENMYGDILSDLAGGLVGGMGMAACAEIGDHHGLFQPAHGSAPDIMGRDAANPLACILSGSLLLGYLAEKSGQDQLDCAAEMIESAVFTGFSSGRLRPLEFGGDQGTLAVARELLNILPTVG